MSEPREFWNRKDTKTLDHEFTIKDSPPPIDDLLHAREVTAEDLAFEEAIEVGLKKHCKAFNPHQRASCEIDFRAGAYYVLMRMKSLR